MSLLISQPPRPAILYPDSDGQPMAENTQQYEWIVTIKGNLDILFLDRTDVFVAGDLLWYPVEGDPKIRTAPDSMVAFGRPKGHRGSYRQWEEGGIAPQVVFEVLSPGNRPGKMGEKFQFYDRFGVEEYYIYDPDTNELGGFQRAGDGLKLIPEMDGWASPLLGIHFDCSGPDLKISYPDGRPFQTFTEMGMRERAIAQERDAIAAERDRERERAEKLAARLRELGVDPQA
jgi:Uma2 family endonuclease